MVGGTTPTTRLELSEKPRIYNTMYCRRVLRYWFIGLFFFITSTTRTSSLFALMPAQTDLLTLIRQLGTDIPFTKDKLTRRLATSLHQVSENAYFTFFEGGPVRLANGVIVAKIDLRINSQTADHPGFLVLTLAGQCVTLPEVRQYYPKLVITDTPRGRSVNEVTSLTSTETWGTLSFSFPVRNERCASAIVFDPKPL